VGQRALRLERFVAFQAQYSLVVRDIEREHVPLCQKYGLGILPWSPLAGGFLSGKLTRTSRRRRGRGSASGRSGARPSTTRNWKIIDELREVAEAIGASRRRWRWRGRCSKPGITSVIFGARSPEQLHDNLKSAELVLPESELMRGSTRRRRSARLPVRVHAQRAGALVAVRRRAARAGRARRCSASSRTWLPNGSAALRVSAWPKGKPVTTGTPSTPRRSSTTASAVGLSGLPVGGSSQSVELAEGDAADAAQGAAGEQLGEGAVDAVGAFADLLEGEDAAGEAGA
jgi:hypothetical protein